MNTPQALVLADELEDCPHSVETEFNAATLLRTQHEAIERKDALLRQALEFIEMGLGAEGNVYGVQHNNAVDVANSITKEL